LFEDESIKLLVRWEEDKATLASQQQTRAIVLKHYPAPVRRGYPEAHFPNLATKEAVPPWYLLYLDAVLA